MVLTASLPNLQGSGPGTGHGTWIVVVYDNDHNSPEEVVNILLVATKCTMEEAQTEMWEVHNLGKSVVHHGGQQACEDVAQIVRTIGIRVEVREE